MIEVYVCDRGDLPAVTRVLAEFDHGEPRIDQATRRVSTALPDTAGKLPRAVPARSDPGSLYSR